MTTKVTSKHLTASITSNLRFTKKIQMVATEVGAFSSDVLGITPDTGKFFEIEIKVSKSDLLADFKKEKHEYYLSQYRGKELYKASRHWKYYNAFVPRQFFFCVPEFMLDYTLEAVDDLPYGVICYRETNLPFPRRVRVEKRAKSLHDNGISPNVIDAVLKRMSSELCNFHIDRAYGKL